MPTAFALLLFAGLAADPMPARTVTLEDDVQPILTRAGCNQGACHGKQRGQNGFQLSLLAFDPEFDYQALVTEGRGRRVLPAAPEASLLLRKGAAQVPHGGGKKISPGDPFYETLQAWIRQGMPRKQPGSPTLERISVSPTQRQLAYREQFDLKVTAHFSDGSQRDVTPLATFQSSESVFAGVSATGQVTAGPLPGEAAITARFMDAFAVCSVLIPLPGTVDPATYATLPREHFIDRHVWTKLQQMGMTPSEDCGDAAFQRRAHLDIIGRLPSADEARAFLADASPDKRARLIDRLLERPEYADHWANKWADLLRPNPYRVGMKATYTLDSWLRRVFRENWPYDRFVREILTAQGSTFRHGPTVVFRDRREPAEMTTMLAQLFLGIRLDCARCHHHPQENYGQAEFFSFAAYFAKVGRKGTGISPPISGSEEIITLASKGDVTHPLTNQVMTPRPLFGTAPEIAEGDDPRRALADWVTDKDNPFFGQVIVNRMWAEFMSRGLVEPVDDLRATNPPTNPALLEALAADFRKNGCDLKHLIRTITTSKAYALSSRPNERNLADQRSYARHYRRRLRAEVLLDAVCDVTGVQDKFSSSPPGTRAAALWTVRGESHFLDSFGRPDPNQDPPCERVDDTTVVQALHLMNARNLHGKLTSDTGRIARLAASDRTPEQLAEELYLSVYSRLPTVEERTTVQALFDRPGVSRRQTLEDLAWALINTPEFTFNN